MKKESILEVEGKQLKVSNLDKVLYPKAGFTKADIIDYCVANNLPTLVWAANLADIEMHTTLAKCQNPERPTMLVFDLDPGPPAHIVHCIPVAFWLREIFDALDLKCFPKTSGSQGLQIYVPLNTPVSFDQTKPFARAVAELL